jgi:RimJ/RimL family protein N-acetyltransferase
VSPPDEHGYFSLGATVDVTRTAAETARLVIAQVNPKMPRTYGPALIHAAEVDIFVEHKEALPELLPEKPDETMQAICSHIRRLVPDGATLQVGAGRLTDAIFAVLKDKEDLGLHTELFSDGAMKLARAGVLTGKRKSLHAGRMVATLAAGSRALYKFLDKNPAVELHPSDYVNSPLIVARNYRMTAVNLAEAIDLTGQVSSGLFGPDFLTGPPGRADFMRGAAQTVDGKPILALPSTRETPDGPASRILSGFPEGTEILLTRSDVHYVVTEHGIAYLHGKCLRERALALIAVAHPDFRDGLMEAAQKSGLIPPHHPVPRLVPAYPEELERWVTLRDGTEVLLRPLKPEDGELMKDLFYSFSEKTRYLRFHQMVKEMPQRGKQAFFNVDYREELALAAARLEDGVEEFIGTGRFVLDEGTGSAEVAFVVRDDWQGKGLGRSIFEALAEIAEERGIHTLTAEILAENQPMLRVMDKTGYTVSTRRESGVVHVEVDLKERKRD